MYVVIGLIVFVDLIIVVGIGVFIVNILIIDCLIQLKFEDVKVIIDVDDVIILDNDEKELLDCVEGKILLFYLSGLMIFGVFKVIFCQYIFLNNYKVLIVDLSEVFYMGVIFVLVIENVIQEIIDMGCDVFLVGVIGSVK